MCIYISAVALYVGISTYNNGIIKLRTKSLLLLFFCDFNSLVFAYRETIKSRYGNLQKSISGRNCLALSLSYTISLSPKRGVVI